MKKFLLLVLSLVLMLSITVSFSACGDKDLPNEVDLSDEEDTEQDPDAALYQNLNKANYAAGGSPMEFNILHNISNYGLVTMEAEMNGVKIDEAIYERNRFIEEQLGIVFNVESDTYSSIPGRVTNDVMGGLHYYHICYNESYKQTELALQGAYRSVNDYEDYIDFEMPWWYQDVLDDTTIAGNNFLIAGDMSMMLNDAVWCIAFNRRIIQDHGGSDPFALVREGKWTYEELYKLSKDTLVDGRYGIVSHYGVSAAFVVGGDQTLIVKDTDGGLVHNSFGDRFVSIYQDVVRKFFEKNGVGEENCIRTSTTSQNYLINESYTGFNEMDTFTSGQATFVGQVLGSFRQSLPHAEIDYGIVPMPKYEETQKNYVSLISRSGSLCGVLASVEDEDGMLERVCNILEWFNAYSYKYVLPVYYDVILTGRIARNAETAEMLDIICALTENSVKRTELDGLYNFGMTGVLQLYASDCKPNISTGMQGLYGSIENKIRTMTDYYKYN